MVSRSLALVCLLALLAAPSALAEEFVRDQIRVKLRTGPAANHEAVRLLISGERLRRLGEEDGWAHVQTRDHQEGWVQVTYLTPNAPASVSLPKVEAALKQAETRITQLDAKLSSHGNAVQELETLRKRNEQLETENTKLVLSSTWRAMLAGAAILAVGILVGGLLLPRATAARSRRIKL